MDQQLDGRQRRLLRWPRVAARLGASRANMAVIAAAYVIIGVSLAVQPSRWAATPAYHDLLVIMPQQAWAVFFLAAAAGLTAGLRWYRHRWLAVATLTFAIMLTTAWALAFVVRWATSGTTTPETWVSWLVFDHLLLRAAYLLDYEEVAIRPGTPGQGDR